MDIYLRELREDDALISYKWRNNPSIWKYTGSKPDKIITPEIELAWIRIVLQRNNERRCAICLKSNDEYIGNVQLTNIINNKAEFHIFIGNAQYWGKGIGKNATTLMLDIGFNELHLEEIYLFVDPNNQPAVNAYISCGFKIKNNKKNKMKMSFKNDRL